jgi:hypothetical protein
MQNSGQAGVADKPGDQRSRSFGRHRATPRRNAKDLAANSADRRGPPSRQVGQPLAGWKPTATMTIKNQSDPVQFARSILGVDLWQEQ